MSSDVQPDTLKTVFKENMRQRRKALGLTQNDLAQKLGVHQPYVAELENGGKTPLLDTLARLADALLTTPDALLTPRGTILEKIGA